MLAVGAPGADGGTAYVFLETAGQWSEIAKLVPPDGDAGWAFGRGVAVYGGRLAVGAAGYSFAADEHGAVYTYRQAGPAWDLTGTLVYRAPGASVNPIGHTIDLDDEWLVAGHQSPFGFLSAPQAPLWHRSGEMWTEVARLDSTLFDGGADQWAGGVGVQSDLKFSEWLATPHDDGTAKMGLSLCRDRTAMTDTFYIQVSGRGGTGQPVDDARQQLWLVYPTGAMAPLGPPTLRDPNQPVVEYSFSIPSTPGITPHGVYAVDSSATGQWSSWYGILLL